MWTSRLFGKMFAAYLLLVSVVAVVPLMVIVSWQEAFVMGYVRDQLLDTDYAETSWQGSAGPERGGSPAQPRLPSRPPKICSNSPPAEECPQA